MSVNFFPVDLFSSLSPDIHYRWRESTSLPIYLPCLPFNSSLCDTLSFFNYRFNFLFYFTFYHYELQNISAAARWRLILSLPIPIRQKFFMGCVFKFLLYPILLYSTLPHRVLSYFILFCSNPLCPVLNYIFNTY